MWKSGSMSITARSQMGEGCGRPASQQGTAQGVCTGHSIPVVTRMKLKLAGVPGSQAPAWVKPASQSMRLEKPLPLPRAIECCVTSSVGLCSTKG